MKITYVFRSSGDETRTLESLGNMPVVDAFFKSEVLMLLYKRYSKGGWLNG